MYILYMHICIYAICMSTLFLTLCLVLVQYMRYLEEGAPPVCPFEWVHLASVAPPPRHSGVGRGGEDQSLPGTLHTPVQANFPAC